VGSAHGGGIVIPKRIESPVEITKDVTPSWCAIENPKNESFGGKTYAKKSRKQARGTIQQEGSVTVRGRKTRDTPEGADGRSKKASWGAKQTTGLSPFLKGKGGTQHKPNRKEGKENAKSEKDRPCRRKKPKGKRGEQRV